MAELPFPALRDSSIALEEYPYSFSSASACTCMPAMLRLKQSALELVRPHDPYDWFMNVLLMLPRASTELALKRVPAVSKTLSGRSLHLIQGSLMRSHALYLRLLSVSNSRYIRLLASLLIVSGYL